MKLQTRTNLNYIIVSAIIYVIVAVSFYIAVKHVIYEEVDTRLLVEKSDFENFVDRNGYWETESHFVEDKVDVIPVFEASPVTYTDTILQSRIGSQYVPFRQLSFDKTIGNTLYRVTIRKSLIESNRLLRVITSVMLVVLCAGLSLLYIVQQRTSKRLWKPFYDALSKAKEFNIHRGDKLTLPPQKIYEFNELNSALNTMTETILNDYQSLKEFTENASHEIQTPLALINSRIEGLIQDSSISGKNIQWIQDIHESVMRLSKLNHALLLLAKIDNRQYQETHAIDLNEVLTKQLEAMGEAFTLKSISLTIAKSESFITPIHPVLAEILIGNLLNNAVKHNIPNAGFIKVQVSSGNLTIANSGPPLTTDPRKLLERFQKQNTSTASLGLGLAIINKICQMNHLDLSYTYENDVHTISISKQDIEI